MFFRLFNVRETSQNTCTTLTRAVTCRTLQVVLPENWLLFLAQKDNAVDVRRTITLSHIACEL